jgi:pimeloyl-ACP methyl ester carboxylesterase
MVQIGCPALFLGSAPRFLRVLATPRGDRVLIAARRPTRAAARALLTRLGEAQAAKELPAEFLELYGLARYRSATRAAWRSCGRPAKSARGAVAPHRGAISPISQPTLFLWGEREPYAPRSMPLARAPLCLTSCCSWCPLPTCHGWTIPRRAGTRSSGSLAKNTEDPPRRVVYSQPRHTFPITR